MAATHKNQDNQLHDHIEANVSHTVCYHLPQPDEDLLCHAYPNKYLTEKNDLIGHKSDWKTIVD